MDARSGQQCSIESWQGALFSVEGGVLVLDVPGLDHAAGLGVVVGVTNHGLRQIHSMVHGEQARAEDPRCPLFRARQCSQRQLRLVFTSQQPLMEKQCMSVYVGDPFVEEETSQDTTISAQLLAHLPWIQWSQATYSGYCKPQDTIKIMLSAGVRKQNVIVLADTGY